MAEGDFRKDLFYRLDVFPIQVPPLRERVDDIPILVEYLVNRYAKKAGKRIRSISKRTLQLFESYEWPGNVRELQNVIERAVIVCDNEIFQVDASWLKATAPMTKASVAFVADIAERERAMIEDALCDSKGTISGPGGAAAKLGLPRKPWKQKSASCASTAIVIKRRKAFFLSLTLLRPRSLLLNRVEMLNFGQMLIVRASLKVRKAVNSRTHNGLAIADLQVRCGLPKMTWKIEKHSDGPKTAIRLIGRMQVEHLEDLELLIDKGKPTIALDPEELMAVDLEGVRFLVRCLNDGLTLLH